MEKKIYSDTFCLNCDLVLQNKITIIMNNTKLIKKTTKLLEEIKQLKIDAVKCEEYKFASTFREFEKEIEEILSKKELQQFEAIPCAVINKWLYKGEYNLSLAFEYSENNFSLRLFNQNTNVEDWDFPNKIKENLRKQGFIETAVGMLYNFKYYNSFEEVSQKIKDAVAMLNTIL